MAWDVGYSREQDRDIGYGVPCICEHPDCDREINRGIAYCCGGYPSSTCGQYFCPDHLSITTDSNSIIEKVVDRMSGKTVCQNCLDGVDPFPMKPDINKWIIHKLTDPSWEWWRLDNTPYVEANKYLLPPESIKISVPSEDLEQLYRDIDSIRISKIENKRIIEKAVATIKAMDVLIKRLQHDG